ncbi:MAG: outer membrane beta-barrel protein [Steroidobacteraceae bacterium]
MKIVKAMVASLLLAALPLAAQAEGMSYSYIDLGYVETDIDNGPTADGFGVRGSVGFAENYFVFAEYTDQDLRGVDIEQFAVGLGGHLGLSETLDLVGRFGYLDAEVSAGGASASADGYLVSAGLRGQVAEDFELEGHVIHRDLGNQGGDDTALSIGGRYFFTGQFALGLEYETSDDADTIFVGGRLSF